MLDLKFIRAGLVKAAIRRFVFSRQRFILQFLSLENPVPEIRLGENVVIRKANLSDVRELRQVTEEYNLMRSAKVLSKRIRKGCFFVATVEGKIVGYACVVLEFPGGLITKPINSKDDDAWGSDGFALPPYRGNKIFPALGIETMKCAKGAGYRRIFSTVSSNNFSARSAFKKMGYKEIKEVTFFRVLFIGTYCLDFILYLRQLRKAQRR